jgi:hypothetical protein
MKKLNKDVTKILLKFLKRIKQLPLLDIRLSGRDTLRLEIGERLRSEYGYSYLFSIGTMFDEKTPKFRQYMEFIVEDLSGILNNEASLNIWPITYREDSNTILETCCVIREGHPEEINKTIQLQLVNQAKQYVSELNAAGYIGTR